MAAGITACIEVSESMVKDVAGMPLNFTAVALLKPLPVMVTSVPCGPDAGENDVIVAPLQFGFRVPYSVKSSSLMLPLPVAPVRVKTTVRLPVISATGVLTGVTPMAAPVVGMVPVPTVVPFMAIDQFCGPELLRCRQKLNDVISASKLSAISNVSVMVVTPGLLKRVMAWPVAPTLLLHAAVLLAHDELERFAFKVTGAAL
jgi:hypothetical protein